MSDNMGGYLGAAGARTSERKSWFGEIAKGLILTLVVWGSLCIIWGMTYLTVLLLSPESKFISYFRSNPRVFWAIDVAIGIPCFIGLVLWALQELGDADWTSLKGNHDLSGIMPMTPAIRGVLFLRWLRKTKPSKKGSNIEQELADRLKGK